MAAISLVSQLWRKGRIRPCYINVKIRSAGGCKIAPEVDSRGFEFFGSAERLGSVDAQNIPPTRISISRQRRAGPRDGG